MNLIEHLNPNDLNFLRNTNSYKENRTVSKTIDVMEECLTIGRQIERLNHTRDEKGGPRTEQQITDRLQNIEETCRILNVLPHLKKADGLKTLQELLPA